MAKTKTVFKCSTCGDEWPRWQGKCSGCGDWNTMEEVAPITATSTGAKPSRRAEPVAMSKAAADPKVVLPTGLSEFDRVLGGGLVLGSVSLLGGEPGIGKSTLILQLCAAIAKQNGRCLIVTGEESVDQVGRRAARLGADLDNVFLLAESEVEVNLAAMAEIRPKLVIVDSVQTMTVNSSSSSAGTVAQVRESASAYTSYAKEHDVATVLVGHVTKDGNLAGPRVLEHLVDTVIEFEGDRHHGLRFLRAVKHRFGATDEVGVLEMTEKGLASVTDASALFLDDRQANAFGSTVTPTLQGRRPMLVEVQSLASGENDFGRRYAQGLDSNRLAMIVAVLAEHAGVKFVKGDVYASVIGGLRVNDPGIDLALALSLASVAHRTSVPEDIVAIGELGLTGDVRKATDIKKRLGEAQRMGFKRAIVPLNTADDSEPGITLLKARNIADAVEFMLGNTPAKPRKRA